MPAVLRKAAENAAAGLALEACTGIAVRLTFGRRPAFLPSLRQQALVAFALSLAFTLGELWVDGFVWPLLVLGPVLASSLSDCLLGAAESLLCDHSKAWPGLLLTCDNGPRSDPPGQPGVERASQVC